MRLQYVLDNGTVIASTVSTDTPEFTDWVYYLIELYPNTIFFYTVDSTDIWS